MFCNVTSIVDGDTFAVSPRWTWNSLSGDRVRPTGCDTPELGQPGYVEATQKLRTLLLGKTIELQKAYRVDRGRLVCDVYLNGRNLADYFPEYERSHSAANIHRQFQ